MSIQPTSSRSLPVLACIKHTLNSTMRYRAAAIRIALPWVVIITLVNLIVAVASGDFQQPVDFRNMTGGAALREILLFAVSLLGASSIAINWHRYILRDLMPAGMAEILRFDAPVWRYASFTLLNLVVVMVPALLLMTLNMTLLPAVPVAIIAVLVAAVFMLRLSLVLPAIALERIGFGYREAISATRGQMLPLTGLLLVNMALIFATLLGFGLLLLLANALPAPMNAILASVTALVVNLVLAIYSVSLLSSLYGFYIERRDF